MVLGPSTATTEVKMGLITNMYKKNFLHRYDKDEAIPYFSASDFPGLGCEENVFENSVHVPIRFFKYYYSDYDRTTLVLFCPGMGPGHTAYLAEIETLCRAGYPVLTLDYTGCGASGGERLNSINAPTRDMAELIERLQPRERLVLIGHSLGGYTALNLAHLLPTVHKAVILSGFVSVADVMIGFVKLRLLANIVKSYEKKLLPRYGNLNNRAYLKSTSDKLLWIHSTDDPMVNFKHNAGQVLALGNPNVRVLTVEHKKHNPQYSKEALDTMNNWMGEYYRLIKEEKLVSLESRKAFFADKPIGRMTMQDPEIFAEILDFIRG